MLECRTKTTNVIKEYIESKGYLLSDASRFSHSLDAFHYNYKNAGENRDMIKIEINYSLRAHIFEPVYKRTPNSRAWINIAVFAGFNT